MAEEEEQEELEDEEAAAAAAAMGEEGEDGEEEPGGPRPDSPAPPSTLSPQKRPLSSTSSSHSSLSSVPGRKKTRDLPDLHHCHSCGLRFPDKGRNERLRTLESEWRVVLLCQRCLRSVRSAEVCSYCFSKFNEGGEGFFDCRDCSCRVHLGCIPEQRGFIASSELDPDAFTCVDCRALPKSPNRKTSNFRGCRAARVSSVSLEDVVMDAKCAMVEKAAVAARAKEEALVKAVLARRAAEVARNALDLVVLTEKETKNHVETVVADEELALQLHWAMNGSQRILRDSCHVNSDRLTDTKRERCKNNPVGMESECASYSFIGKVEFCTEDKCFGMEILDAKPLDSIAASDVNACSHLDARPREDQKTEISEHSRDNLAEMLATEEQASCSNKVVASTGDENSVDSVSASCQRPSVSNATPALSKDNGEDSFRRLQQEMCSVPDRYLKKYSKRIPTMKTMKDLKENQGSSSVLVPIGR